RVRVRRLRPGGGLDPDPVEDRCCPGVLQRSDGRRLGNLAVPFLEKPCELLGAFAVHGPIVIRRPAGATLHTSWKLWPSCPAAGSRVRFRVPMGKGRWWLWNQPFSWVSAR